MRCKIAILPGDGIGGEIIPESIKVLNKIGLKFEHEFLFDYGNIGGNAIDKMGVPLPRETLKLCEDSDAILFGAVGGPKWDDMNAKYRPEDGILSLRKSMELFANLRPVKIFPALISSSPLKSELIGDVDMMIVRELTGGLYFSQPKKRWVSDGQRYGVDTLGYSESEIDRILRVGFELAKTRRSKLTSADKANVLETSRLWRELAVEISKDYPEVEIDHMYVDNLSMQLISQPGRFDVIVTENTFGDILSDEAAVLIGSLGMLPSASLAYSDNKSKDKRVGLYEPVHGSAPDIAGKSIANPIGAILSVALMLGYSFSLFKEAEAINRAVNVVLDMGYRSADIASRKEKSISTSEMGDLITEYI